MRYSLVFSVVQIVFGTSYNVVKVSVGLFLSKNPVKGPISGQQNAKSR